MVGARSSRTTATLATLGATLLTALLAGCTTPDPTPTPTPPAPTSTTDPDPADPGFDPAAPAIDLLLPSQEPVVLNGVELIAAVSAHADEGRLGIESEDGFVFSEILQPGDAVEVPGWGVVGIVEVERYDQPTPGDDDAPGMPNPTGTILVRAQLSGPYTLTGHSLPATVVIEPTADGAEVTVGKDDPVALTAPTSSRFDWGTVEVTRTDDGAERPWRVEVRVTA